MAIIFAGGNGTENRGRVAVLSRPGGNPAEILSLPGWGGFSGFKSIITGFEFTDQENVQFQHTLGNEVYAYVFGSKIGSFSVSGLSFFDVCDGSGLAGGGIGLTAIREYYRINRISARSSPLLLTLYPSTVFRCYLIGMRGRVSDSGMRLFEFALNLISIP